MKTIAYCKTCNRKLIGNNLNRIGGNYYCHSDYSKELEKQENYKTRIRTREEKELLTEFENLIDTDFDNWTASGITANEKELTVAGSGTIRHETEMKFGLNYNLSTRLNKNGLSVTFYNYNSDDTITKTISDGTFLSIGKSFIISILGTGTITVEELILVEA